MDAPKADGKLEIFKIITFLKNKIISKVIIHWNLEGAIG